MLRASAQHIIVTPLAGTQLDAADPTAPQATLIRIDRLTILVDCGASLDFGTEVVDAVRPFAASIDAVLLSSSELRCCGSLPMVLDILRPDVVVCGTIPTAKVGLLSTITHMLDRVSTAEAEPQLPARVTAVHAAFKRIREVQFEQSVKLTPLASSASHGTATAVQVRAHAAGRVAGAAAYLITHQSDSVLLCHHAVPDSIRSMSVRSFDPPTGGATVIVADAGAMGRESTVDAQDTEKRALRVIRDTFRRGGSVLIPVDTFAAGAEVLVLLQKLFAEEGLSYPLVFASPKASAYTDRLRTLIEFVRDGVFSEEHDEAFPGVTMANSHDELDALPTAKCVIAQCSADFTAGFGAALLTAHLQDPLSAVILPQPLAVARNDGNLETMRRLVDGNRPPGPMRIDAWSYLRRDLLEGDTLADFMDELAAKKDQEAEAAAGLDNEGRDAVMIQELTGPNFDDDDDEDEDGSPENAPGAANNKNNSAATASTSETHPRLVLPAHFPPFNSAFPLFPPVQLSLPPSATNTAGVDANTSIYGETLPDADIRRFRQHTAQHTYAEAALSAAQIVRTAVQVDSAPARVVPVTIPLVAKAPVHVFDLSRRCTGDALRSMLGDSLAGARKLVFIGGTLTDAAAARSWAEAARVTKHPDSTFAPRTHESVDVASAVYSLEARIDPALMPPNLPEVPSANGVWGVGWIAASVTVDMADLKARPPGGFEQATKRNRAEVAAAAAADDDDDDGDDERLETSVTGASAKEARSRKALPLLVPAAAAAAAASGARPSAPVDGVNPTTGRKRHEHGSVFVGDVDLAHLAAAVHGERHVPTETTAEKSVIVAADAIAVRRRARDGQFALEAALCPELFAVRAALYERFGCIL